MSLPRTWNPVRIEGSFAAGRVEWADHRGPALGLRWSTPRPRRLEPDVAARQALQNEVGMLAADEAKPGIVPSGDSLGLRPGTGPSAFGDSVPRGPRSTPFLLHGEPSPHEWVGALLYEEPAPPGRDVWSAYSPVTGRLIQIVYFTTRRDTVLRDRLLPTLIDHPVGRATPWAIFDLDLIAPAEATLLGHRFHAGDLAMRFEGPIGPWTVRQLAPASLALSRQSLPEWATAVPPTIGTGDQPLTKHYRLSRTGPSAIAADARAIWRRKRRYFWRPALPPTRILLAHVDPIRDRLLLLEGTDEALLGEIRRTIGRRI